MIDLMIGIIEKVGSIIFNKPQRGKVEDYPDPNENIPTVNSSPKSPLIQALGRLGTFPSPVAPTTAYKSTPVPKCAEKLQKKDDFSCHYYLP